MPKCDSEVTKMKRQAAAYYAIFTQLGHLL